MCEFVYDSSGYWHYLGNNIDGYEDYEAQQAIADLTADVNALRDSVSSITYTVDTLTVNSDAIAAWSKTVTKQGFYPIGYEVYHSNAANWEAGAEIVNPELGKIFFSGFHATTEGTNRLIFMRVTWMRAL